MKDILIDALVDLYQRGPRYRDLGICSHVGQYIEGLDLPYEEACKRFAGAEALMEELFQEWPEFSGSVTYPVPGDVGESQSAAFYTTKDLWVGDYGEKRWALAEFMLRTLANGAT